MQYAPRINGRFAQVYSESFRRKVIEEYLSGNVSKMFLLRKYNIKMKSCIQRWMKLYGYADHKQPVIICPRWSSFIRVSPAAMPLLGVFTNNRSLACEETAIFLII